MVRISVAVLITLRIGDEVVLFRSTIRPESLAPPGGVRKFFNEARSQLDEFGFTGERLTIDRPDELDTDLRGKVRAVKLLAFRRWVRHGAHIEGVEACALRELREELKEIGCRVKCPHSMSFRIVRTYEQWPWSRETTSPPWQYRNFVVVELRPNSDVTVAFLGSLKSTCTGSDNLEIVNHGEAQSGRCEKSGSAIANHSQLLFEARLDRPDRPLFSAKHLWRPE
jgi:hypothetical protein